MEEALVAPDTIRAHTGMSIQLSSLTPATAPGFTVRVTVANVKCVVTRDAYRVAEIVVRDDSAIITACISGGHHHIELATRAGAVLVLRNAAVSVNRAGSLRLEVGSCGNLEAGEGPAHAGGGDDLPDLSAATFTLDGAASC